MFQSSTCYRNLANPQHTRRVVAFFDFIRTLEKRGWYQFVPVDGRKRSNRFAAASSSGKSRETDCTAPHCTAPHCTAAKNSGNSMFERGDQLLVRVDRASNADKLS